MVEALSREGREATQSPRRGWGVPLHPNGLLGYGEVLDRITSLESKLAELADRFARLEERMLVVEEELRGGRRLMVVIAHRFGTISEGVLMSSLKYVVEEVFG